MSAIIQQLKDNITKNILYPVTKTKAVYDDDNNKLSDVLDTKVNTTDKATSISTTPVDSKWVTEKALYNYIASGNGGKPRALDNVDLNTISATGFYSCNVCTNRPTEHNGVMFVMKNSLASDNVVQVYFTFQADVMWVRHKDLGNWKAWRRIYNKGDVDGLLEGKISGVKVAGSELAKDEDGKVDIPIATSSSVGVVKAHKQLTLSLTVAWWTNKTQTVTATGVTATNTVIVSPSPSDIDKYAQYGIVCTSQGTDSLTFTCKTVPTEAISVGVVVL